MTTFTSTLPDDLLKELRDAVNDFKISDNELIEKSLRLYIEILNKDAYIKSYREMCNDPDMIKYA